MTRATVTLAFANFLRIGEFTYQAIDLERRASFQNWFLTKSTVWFIKNLEQIKLTLPSSKTNPSGKKYN